MEKLNYFAQKHILIFTTILITFVFMIYTFAHITFSGKTNSMTDWMDSAVYLIPITITYTLLGIMQLYGNAGFHIKGFGNGLWLGSYLLFACVCMFLSNYPSGSEEIIIPQFSKVILFVLNCIGVGVFEEGLFRGIVLNNMLRKWGSTKKGIYRAAIVSSVFFGISHIINLLVKPDYLVGTIAEMIYACFFESVNYFV